MKEYMNTNPIYKQATQYCIHGEYRMVNMIDLPVEAFIVLRNELFKKNGEPKQFHLRDKRGTQDDPFDEHIHELLQKNIKKNKIYVINVCSKTKFFKISSYT